MTDYKLRNQYSELLDPTQPLAVDSVEGNNVTPHSETLTYNGKAAAGAISINSTTIKAIVSIEGDQVASYWGLDKNKVYTALVDSQATQRGFKHWAQNLVETDGSSTVDVFDDSQDLELLFESLTTTVKRFVLKATDASGNVLYGWIFGVAKSGNVYTFDVVNNRLTETQNWFQGGSTAFDPATLVKVEIFRYNSSLTFGTGTTLLEEVQAPREYSKAWFNALEYASKKLTDGQYFVDYMRGRIISSKADTVASETITYKVWSSLASGGTTVTSDINLNQVGGVSTDVNLGSPTAGTQRVVEASKTPESGTDAIGEDTYATILTPSTTFNHILIFNEGSNPATVSIDEGVTATFVRIPGGGSAALDAVAITATAIQGKNASAGNNYADLTVIVW